jgi:adenine-specific DNA-methyltransferase
LPPSLYSEFDLFHNLTENDDYLTGQIITYLGNKRSLLGFIARGVRIARERLGKERLHLFDVFSGSGVVARSFKRSAELLLVNDLEHYAEVVSSCYLSNRDELDMPLLRAVYEDIIGKANSNEFREGIVAELYAPKDDANIQSGERVFYTHRNAVYIDTVRRLIDDVPENMQKFFLAPLLAEASVHSNTSGVFKGFYKNRQTGVGQFGGSGEDALLRIQGPIELPFPVFSNFSCPFTVFRGDANQVVREAPEVDLAYLDPPYNQHPYGSNYFMLNLILENRRPPHISTVSGIPDDWNRSEYNKKAEALAALTDLVENIKAKFVLVSFNSEGFISLEEMKEMLEARGRVEILETSYNTFRGCRNLSGRPVHVKEYLYLLEKR